MFEWDPLPEPIEMECETLDDGRHYHHPDGHDLRSVTTIIGEAMDKTGLYEWRENVGDDEADRVSGRARTAGRAVHNLCEDYVKNRTVTAKDVMPINYLAFKSIARELDAHLGTVYATEYPLHSTRLMTAGRTDLLAQWDGIDSVIDYKNVSKRKEFADIIGYFTQGGAYSVMAEERTGRKFPQVVVILAVAFEDRPQVFKIKTDHVMPLVEKIFVAGVEKGSIRG